jgi:hypothetical protein
LVDSALDEAGVEALCTKLREAGAVGADHAPLENADGLIGYVVTARFA